MTVYVGLGMILVFALGMAVVCVFQTRAEEREKIEREQEMDARERARQYFTVP
jgi:hypothetical protein